MSTIYIGHDASMTSRTTDAKYFFTELNLTRAFPYTQNHQRNPPALANLTFVIVNIGTDRAHYSDKIRLPLLEKLTLLRIYRTIRKMSVLVFQRTVIKIYKRYLLK